MSDKDNKNEEPYVYKTGRPRKFQTVEEMQNSMGWLIKGLKMSGYIQ